MAMSMPISSGIFFLGYRAGQGQASVDAIENAGNFGYKEKEGIVFLAVALYNWGIIGGLRKVSGGECGTS